MYLIHKGHYQFDELKFTYIAIDCAERARSEQTFGCYFWHSLKKELEMRVICPKDIFNKGIPINL